MQNKLLKIARMGLALVILAFGALPALAQDCVGWGDKEWKVLENFWINITPEQVQACLNNGADLNAEGEHGYPLHLAASSNENPNVIKVLLDAGVDVNTRSRSRNTPLHWAVAGNKNPNVIKVLLDAGADVNARNGDGGTPLHWAASQNENPEIINVLLKSGAKLEVRNKLGQTPIYSAVGRREKHNSLKIIMTLIDAGSNVNAQGKDTSGVTSWSGYTPLHWAAIQTKNPDVIMILLKAGADGKIKSEDRKTPFEFAKYNSALKDTKAYWALSDAQY